MCCPLFQLHRRALGGSCGEAADLQEQQETWQWQGPNAASGSLHLQRGRDRDILFPDVPVSLQTVADCVLYYYLTKKNENYKNLVRRNYRRRGKSQVRAVGAHGNVVPWAERRAAGLRTCSFSAALSLSTPNASFLPSPEGGFACRLQWGCGFALCSFSEQAVFWQLMFVRPRAKVVVALKKQTTNPRCLKKGTEQTQKTWPRVRSGTGLPVQPAALSENQAGPISLSPLQLMGTGLCAGDRAGAWGWAAESTLAVTWPKYKIRHECASVAAGTVIPRCPDKC